MTAPKGLKRIRHNCIECRGAMLNYERTGAMFYMTRCAKCVTNNPKVMIFDDVSFKLGRKQKKRVMQLLMRSKQST